MSITPSPAGFSPRYDMQSLMPVIDVTSGPDQLIRPGSRTLVIDPLDQRLVDALESISSYVPRTWTGGKLTTMCYEVHGTPNTKFFVLAYNGLGSETELRPGMVLKFPDKTALDAALSRAYTSASNGVGSTAII